MPGGVLRIMRSIAPMAFQRWNQSKLRIDQPDARVAVPRISSWHRTRQESRVVWKSSAVIATGKA